MKRILFLGLIIFSLSACKKDPEPAFLTKIMTGPGPEDIVYDASHDRLLISCNERRPGYPPHGEIWQTPAGGDTSYILPRINFPADMPFNPHGFDLQMVDGQLFLYVIDHFKDEAHTTAIVRFKVNAHNLEYDTDFQNPLLISPNDLTVLPSGAFYYSNDMGTNNFLDLFSKPYTGSVGYFDGVDTWKLVDTKIAYPNGLFNENGKLYLATSLNKALYTYDIQADGSIVNRTLLNTINGQDNLSDHGDELIVAVHSDLLKFALLSVDPTNLSPSKTYAINKSTGTAKLLFETDGTMISGGSTSLVVRDDLYLSQVFDNFLLKISRYKNR